MNWVKEVLSSLKAIILAPVTNMLCLSGIVLIAISFLDYSKDKGLSLHGQIHIATATAGFILLLVGILLFYLMNRDSTSKACLDYNKGVEIKRGELIIRIKQGEIQSVVPETKNAVIVLPANTTFFDDCVTDKRTAMGAFFLERFPEKVTVLPSLINTILTEKGFRPDANGQFMTGTTIILPDEYAKPAKIIITASTSRIAGTGITSSPHVICSCVEGVLKCTADQRIDSVYLPILGSGHGGIDRGMALLFLLLSILHFSRSYHHIKLVQIIVHPKDIVSLNQSKELRQIVAL